VPRPVKNTKCGLQLPCPTPPTYDPPVELLLLSSSRTPAGYLTDYLPEIRAFAGGIRRALFIPFAAVRLPWEEFARRVSEASGFTLQIARQASDLHDQELVIVGGGNTFQLLKECRERGFLGPLHSQVVSGKTKYLGWSAGANLACPTIRTTNDMPIVDPGGFEALGLLPFQINPHYVSVPLPGHHGETRNERLEEFAHANPGLPVIGLPEGDWIRVSGSSTELRGPHRAMWFEGARAPALVEAGKLPPLFGDTK
jgi:dipeptidase E